MKRILLLVTTLSLAGVYAQVGIYTNHPQGTLDVSYQEEWDATKLQGVVVTKMNTFQRDQMANPVKGLLIYNTTYDCLSVFDGTYWSCTHGEEHKEAPKLTGVSCDNGAKPVLDRNYGDGVHDFVYCPVEINTGSYTATWLNYNLGAEYAKVGTSGFNVNIHKTGVSANNDAKLYGSSFQWQRPADGHEMRNVSVSGSTTTEYADSWTDMGAAKGKFILPPKGENWYENGVYDVSGTKVKLWQAGGVNNPCPGGYHVPTHEEWVSFDNAITQAGKQMWTQDVLPNLAAAGNRSYENGTFDFIKKFGIYYSSTTKGGDSAYLLFFRSGNSYPNYNDLRAQGGSIRCIKD